MNDQSRTLYVIVARANIGSATETSLAAACKRAGLAYKLLVTEDMALDDVAAMRFEPGSLLYRMSIKAHAGSLETALVLLHPSTFTTMYHPKPVLGPTRQYNELIEQIAAGLPIIPSRIIDGTWPSLDDKGLLVKTEDLRGFPVLHKTLGLSHGQGVRKVDSLEELRGIIAQTDFARQQSILREYLEEYRHYRLIVVDGVVVAAIEYHKPADDFRTNATSSPNVSGVDISAIEQGMLDIAVRSVDLASSIIGGVDILLDTSKNRPYLAEVNVPCNFSRAEGPTGIDISGKLLAALVRKRDKGRA